MAEIIEPNDLTLRRRQAIARSIGQLNQEWAYLEFTIDGCVATLHHFFAGTKLEKYRPQTFKSKIDYMTKGARTLSSMTFLKPYLPFLERLIELGNARNWVVHGHIAAVSDDGRLRFVRHSIKSSLPTLEEQIYSLGELQSLTMEMHSFGKIVRELMDWLLNLTDLPPGAEDA